MSTTKFLTKIQSKYKTQKTKTLTKQNIILPSLKYKKKLKRLPAEFYQIWKTEFEGNLEATREAKS